MTHHRPRRPVLDIVAEGAHQNNLNVAGGRCERCHGESRLEVTGAGASLTGSARACEQAFDTLPGHAPARPTQFPRKEIATGYVR